MTKYDVAIVGAGLTGLVISYYLKKADINFICLDEKNDIGGVINTFNEKGFIYEIGPNSGIVGNEYVVKLFDELSSSVKLETANEKSKKRYVLKNGKWVKIPSGPITGAFTPLFTWYDKFRILLEPFRKPGKNPDETLSELVKRRMGKSFLDYAIDPFILGVYAGDPNYIVPKYALPKLYNLEQNYGSFIGGAFKKMREPKTEMEKRVTRKIFSVQGGLSKLTESLYNKSGKENFRLNAKNVSINKSQSGYEINFSQNNNNINIEAKKIVTATGSYSLPSMLKFLDQNELKSLNNLHYTKVVEVILGFNKWDGIPLDGFGGLIPFKENRDILGVLYLSSCFIDRAPKKGALLSVFMGGVRRQDIYKKDEDELKIIIENEIKDLMQLQNFNPDLFKIIKHEWAIPQYGKESKDRFEMIDKLHNKHSNLYIAGNLHNGIGMADRIKQGSETAEKIIKSFGPK
ncbi:MAG: protoporphyrinogen oxidase [Candidatus Delongbacteria bacterium]|nr:protoporphyrinogen oxidase [Candidatus Delongbacteria bacterium]MBN2833772.1 protoporphyrinogen oxidase [Candidatus Delongbacteria bacterium]